MSTLAKFSVPGNQKIKADPAKTKMLKGGVAGLALDLECVKKDQYSVKSLDLAYGYGNAGNPYKKFHQLTMYFNPTLKFTEETTQETNGADVKKATNDSNSTSGQAGDKEVGPFVITANLPANFSYRIGGEWAAPLRIDSGGLLDFLTRTVNNNETSLSAIASTAYIWTRPERLTLNFTIHAFDDNLSNSDTNIQECLQILGLYALPDEGQGVYKNIPSGAQLNFEFINTKGEKKAWKNIAPSQKRLSILVGGMLYVEDLSITHFSVTYPNMKNMLLHDKLGSSTGNRLLPMTADINIELTSVKGITRLAFDKMLMTHSDETNQNLAGEHVTGVIDLRDLKKLWDTATGALGY